MLRSVGRRTKKAHTPLFCSYHSLLTVFPGEEPSKAFPPGKHIPELTGGGGRLGADSVGSYKPSTPGARTTWSLLRAPFPKPGRRGKSEPWAGAGAVNRGKKCPCPRRHREQCSGAERGAAGLPRQGLRAPGTRGLRGLGPGLETGARREEAATPAPGPAGPAPAPARVPALLGLGPWRLQPQRARLIGVESASGRFLHGPPLGLRPGSGPPPLSGWPRRKSPATPQAAEVDPAPGDGGGGGTFGEGSSGTEAGTGRKKRRRSRKWRRAGGRGGGGAERGRGRGEGAAAGSPAGCPGGGPRNRGPAALRFALDLPALG